MGMGALQLLLAARRGLERQFELSSQRYGNPPHLGGLSLKPRPSSLPAELSCKTIKRVGISLGGFGSRPIIQVLFCGAVEVV